MGLPLLLQTLLAMGLKSSNEMPRGGQGRWQVDPFDYPWGGWPGDGPCGDLCTLCPPTHLGSDGTIQGGADMHYPLEGGDVGWAAWAPCLCVCRAKWVMMCNLQRCDNSFSIVVG